jgi:hypothetical protein
LKRALLRIGGWLIAAIWLYTALLILDLYWNIATWRPAWDGTALALIAGVGLGLTAFGFLARSSSTRTERAVGLLIALFFLGLALYVFPAEPLTEGLFARKMSSPLWYRAARLLVMFFPAAAWWNSR